MKKNKGKMELRYYDVPQNEFLIALHGDAWKRKYGTETDLMHFHNLLEIGICHSGRGMMRLEDSFIPYESGMISVIPANYPHNTVSADDSESFWEYLFVDPEKILMAMYPDDILFQQKMLEKVNKKAFFGNEREIPELSKIIYTILNEMRRKPDLYRESVRGMALTLVIMIARMNSDVSSMPEGLRQKNGFDQVRPALEYIRDHYAMPMKVAQIASVCHMSESHFRRLFEENIGMTPVEYLNQVRVKKACDMIKKTGSSMEEIAVKVGFTTTSTFNRNFKRVTGVSPYQWKKQPDNYESRLSNFNILIEKGW